MKSHYFLDNLKRFFSNNKKSLIIIFVIFLLGLLTGIFCTIKANRPYDLTFLQSYTIKSFLIKKSLVTFIFVKSVFVFLLLLAFYFMSHLKFGNVLMVLISSYFAFICGVDVTIIVIVLGLVKGLLIGIIYLICQTALIVLLLLFGFNMSKYNKQMCIYGNSSIKGQEFKIFLFFFLIMFLIILVQGLLMALLCKFFVF